MAEEPPIEESPEEEPITLEPPKKEDYENLKTVIESMYPLAKKINSARILDKLAQLKSMVIEEHKELVYQDYLKSKS